MTFYKKLKTILVFAFFMAVSAITNAAVLTTYYHNDQLGSPIAATDEYGFKLWTENYQAYGERTVNNTNAQENRFWFTGKPQDSNTGLSYFGARYYDPLIGRFMAVDPVGARAGDVHNFNRYAYANNNPYRYVDPDGRIVVTAIVAVSLYLFTEYANTPTTSGDVVDVSGGDALLYTGLALVGGSITQNVSKAAIGGVASLSGKVSAKFLSKGLGSNANFAQKTFREAFSAGGKFAGRSIDDVAGALRSGSVKASDVPIDFITRNGNSLILNTRSAQALTRAGIPRSKWNAINRTGQKNFEGRLNDQLRRNGLTDEGISSVRPSN